jgi:hypothetical protein
MNATKTKRIQRTTLAHRRLYIVVAKLTMMVFYVCVYSEAREANEREKKNFLFFVKRETKRRKNIKNGSQKRKKFKNFALFALFLCFGRETETPTNFGTLARTQIFYTFL